MLATDRQWWQRLDSEPSAVAVQILNHLGGGQYLAWPGQRLEPACLRDRIANRRIAWAVARTDPAHKATTANPHGDTDVDSQTRAPRCAQPRGRLAYRKRGLHRSQRVIGARLHTPKDRQEAIAGTLFHGTAILLCHLCQGLGKNVEHLADQYLRGQPFASSGQTAQVGVDRQGILSARA